MPGIEQRQQELAVLRRQYQQARTRLAQARQRERRRTRTRLAQVLRPELIRRLRQQHEWSQADLAERLGVARNTVDRWEHGHHRPRGAGARNLVGLLEQAHLVP